MVHAGRAQEEQRVEGRQPDGGAGPVLRAVRSLADENFSANSFAGEASVRSRIACQRMAGSESSSQLILSMVLSRDTDYFSNNFSQRVITARRAFALDFTSFEL